MTENVTKEIGRSLKFPDHRDVIRADAEAFRRLSPDQKMKYFHDVLQTGLYLSQISPNRQINDEQFLKREADWQRIQREIFEHERSHGRVPDDLA